MPLVPPKIVKKITGAATSVAEAAVNVAGDVASTVGRAAESVATEGYNRVVNEGLTLGDVADTALKGLAYTDKAKDLPFPVVSTARNVPAMLGLTDTRYDPITYRDVGTAGGNVVRPVPVVGGPLASGVEALVDPLTVGGAGFAGRGLAAELLGRGTQSAPRFAATVFGAGAGARAAEDAGLPPGLQLAAGLVGGVGANIGQPRTVMSSRDRARAATKDPSWKTVRNAMAVASGRTAGIVGDDDIIDPAVRRLLGLDDEFVDSTALREALERGETYTFEDGSRIELTPPTAKDIKEGFTEDYYAFVDKGGTPDSFHDTIDEAITAAENRGLLGEKNLPPGEAAVKRAVGTDDLGTARVTSKDARRLLENDAEVILEGGTGFKTNDGRYSWNADPRLGGFAKRESFDTVEELLEAHPLRAGYDVQAGFTDLDREALQRNADLLDMDDATLEQRYSVAARVTAERMDAMSTVSRGERLPTPREDVATQKALLRRALDLEVGESQVFDNATGAKVWRSARDEWTVEGGYDWQNGEYRNAADAVDAVFVERLGEFPDIKTLAGKLTDAITDENRIYEIMVQRGLRAPRGGAMNSALDVVWQNMRLAGEEGFDAPGNTIMGGRPTADRAATVARQLVHDFDTHESLRNARWRTDGLATARDSELKPFLTKLRVLTNRYSPEYAEVIDEAESMIAAGKHGDATRNLEFVLNSVHDALRSVDEAAIVELHAGLPLYSFKRKGGPLRADRPKPPGKAFYTVDDLASSAARLKRDNPGLGARIQDVLRKTHADTVGRFFEPVEAAASAKRGGDIIPQAVVDYDLARHVEKTTARTGLLTWIADNRKTLGLDGKGFARGIIAQPGVVIHPKAYQRLDDIVENMDDYVLTTAQRAALEAIHDTYEAMLGAQTRAGVKVPQVEAEYFARIMSKSPRGKSKRAAATYLASKKGHQRSRRFAAVRDGIEEGYEYVNPIQAMMTRLEAGIDTIADNWLFDQLKPVSIDPKTRIPSSFAVELRAARAQLKAAGTDQALIDVAQIELQRAKDAAKQARAEAFQPFSTERLYNRRIYPAEVLEELEKYVDIQPGSGKTDTVAEFFNLQRSSMIIGDLSQFFVQGTTLLYRNHPAWWKAVAYSITALAHEPWSYIANNAEFIARGVSYGAISPPAEWLLRSNTRGGMFGRASHAIGNVPGISNLQRSFEWFAFIGQSELWKAQEGMYKNMTETEAKAAASMVRKQLGVVFRPGLTKGGRRLQSFVLFAPSFRASFVGMMKDAVADWDSPAGVEARKTVSMVIAGGTAMTIASSLAINGEMPNLTDPTKKSYLGIRMGDGYVYPYGGWTTYFKAMASMYHHAENGDYEGVLGSISDVLRGGAGVEGAVFLDFMLGKDGAGKPIDRTPAGLALHIMENFGPIGPKGALEPVLPRVIGGSGEGIEGMKRFPARVLEVAGVRTTPLTPAERKTEAQEGKAIPALKAAGKIPANVTTVDQLWKREYKESIQWLRDNGYNDLAEEAEQRRREYSSVLQEKADRAEIIDAEYTPTYDSLYNEILTGTRDPTKVLDTLATKKSERAGRMAEVYADPKYQKAIEEIKKKFGENDGRVLDNQWYQIYREVAGAKGYLTDEDWKVVESRQEEMLSKLPVDVRARFERNLENVDVHPLILLKREVDKQSEDYYDLPEVNRLAYLEEHPNLNVARFLLYGATLHTVAAVDAALAKTSPYSEVGKALATATRDVTYKSFKRPINDALGFWNDSKTAIDKYFNVAVPSGKSATVLKRNPGLNAALAFWGYDVQLHTVAAKRAFSANITQYTEWGRNGEWAKYGNSIMWWMNLSDKEIKGTKKKAGKAVTHPDVDAAYAYYRYAMFGVPPLLYTAAARPYYAQYSGESAVIPVRTP